MSRTSQPIHKTYRVATPNGWFYFASFRGAYNYAEEEGRKFKENVYIDKIDIVESVVVCWKGGYIEKAEETAELPYAEEGVE